MIASENSFLSFAISNATFSMASGVAGPDLRDSSRLESSARDQPQQASTKDERRRPDIAAWFRA